MVALAGTPQPNSTLAFADGADPLDQWLVGVSGRVNLQADIAWPGLQDGYAQAGAQDNANPFQFLYWVLGNAQMHCDQCPQYAAGSPYNAPGSGGNELDATPGDGKTDCGAGCKCSLSYQPGGQLQQQASDAIWSRWYNPQNLQAFATASGIGADLGYGYDPVAVAQAASAERSSQQPPQVRVPVPSDDDLSDEQKAALDAFRVASDRWDAVRGDDLPQAPAFYSERLDEIVGDELPVLEALTAAQRLALFALWEALQQWDEATAPEIDFDQAFSRGEQGAYRLSNPYPRAEHGHFGHGGDHGQHEGEGEGGRGGAAKGERSIKGRPAAKAESHDPARTGRKTAGGHKPPEGYSQIYAKGEWQPARLNLRGEAVPIAGHEGLRFPNTAEGKTALYGWMREHAAGPKATVRYQDEKAQGHLALRLGHAPTDAEIAGLAGALPGAHVTVQRHGTIDVMSADGKTHSVVVINPPSPEHPGAPELMNWRMEDMSSGKPIAPDPRGLRMQVQAARTLGIDSIHMKAQYGSRDYVDLPRVGYNARMDAQLLTETHSKGLPSHLAHVKTLLQLVATPEGARWWEGEGLNPGLDFSTRAGSASMRQLDRVLGESGYGGVNG